MVKGRQTQVNEDVLAEVTCLCKEGERWFEIHTLLQSKTFMFVREEFARKGKGYNLASFLEP